MGMPRRTTTCLFAYLLVILYRTEVEGIEENFCRGSNLSNVLLCEPGTEIKIINITAHAAGLDAPGKCPTSTRTCSRTLASDHNFVTNARSACDGKPVCDRLEVPENMRCTGGVTVDLSYIVLGYDCLMDDPKKFVTRCSGEMFDTLSCSTNGHVLRVTDVYRGASSTCSPVLGDCLHHEEEVVTSYKQQCDGQASCDDVTAHVGEVCGRGSNKTYTTILYKCVIPDTSTVLEETTTQFTSASPESRSTTTNPNPNPTSENSQMSTGMTPTTTTTPDANFSMTQDSTNENVPTSTAVTTSSESAAGPISNQVIYGVSAAGGVIVVGLVVMTVLLVTRKKRRQKRRENKATPGELESDTPQPQDKHEKGPSPSETNGATHHSDEEVTPTDTDNNPVDYSNATPFMYDLASEVKAQTPQGQTPNIYSKAVDTSGKVAQSTPNGQTKTALIYDDVRAVGAVKSSEDLQPQEEMSYINQEALDANTERPDQVTPYLYQEAKDANADSSEPIGAIEVSKTPDDGANVYDETSPENPHSPNPDPEASGAEDDVIVTDNATYGAC